MKAERNLFVLLAVFLGGSTIIYWYTSKDPTGTTALALSAGLGTIIGFYAYSLGRRMPPRPSDRGDADIAEGAGEFGFFSPHSWWPLAVALSASAMVLGLVFGWWLFIIGTAFLMYGTVGMLFQYERHPTTH
jgi:hypothetical protein